MVQYLLSATLLLLLKTLVHNSRDLNELVYP